MKVNNDLKELKDQLQILQQKIEEMEKLQIKDKVENCLIKPPVFENGEIFYYIYDNNSEFYCEEGTVCFNSPENNEMHFADEEQCMRYVEALTTFILLRKQPGSEVAKDVDSQYIIKVSYCGTSLEVDDYSTVGCKLMSISPCFNSEESAYKAIETLGKERVLNMFNYFHS